MDGRVGSNGAIRPPTSSINEQKPATNDRNNTSAAAGSLSEGLAPETGFLRDFPSKLHHQYRNIASHENREYADQGRGRRQSDVVEQYSRSSPPAVKASCPGSRPTGENDRSRRRSRTSSDEDHADFPQPHLLAIEETEAVKQQEETGKQSLVWMPLDHLRRRKITMHMKKPR